MRLSGQFVDPSSYGAYRFSNIPGTIISALTGETCNGMLPEDVFPDPGRKYDKIVLFVVDAFGWSYFNEFKDKHPLLREICKHGKATVLASQFPATTACEITTINTGLDVSQHGIYEWYYYEPEAGDIIAPLLYSYGREHKQRDTLKKDTSLKPSSIYPQVSIHSTLTELGVKCYAFQSNDFARSTYSDIVLKGAEVSGFSTLAEGLYNLADAIVAEQGKAYYYFYFDKIDSLSHQYGPASGQIQAEIETFLTTFKQIFLDRIEGKAENVLFVLTADHGQTVIDPKKCIYLNLQYPEFERYIKRSSNDRLLVPAGSCRDMFLYIKDECLDEALGFLREKLESKAVVYKTSELVEQGYFMRKEISKALAGRLGNIVILPLKGECVWWYEKDVYEINFVGHHGGLTKEEMEIPLLMWEQ
ncbi:MAG TPA: alkaline phosphatase family protein [Methanocellaceae archaeon]